MLRYLSLFFFVAGFGLWGLFSFMARPKPLGLNPVEKLEQSTNLEEAPPMHLKQMEMYEFDGNEETLRIFAQEALVYEEQETSLLFGVLAKIYEKGKSKPTQVKADKASVDGKSDMVVLNGKVELTWDDQSSLRTELLFYDHKKELLFNHQKVWVKSRLDDLEGDSLSYDLKKGILLIENPVMVLFEE